MLECLQIIGHPFAQTGKQRVPFAQGQNKNSAQLLEEEFL